MPRNVIPTEGCNKVSSGAGYRSRSRPCLGGCKLKAGSAVIGPKPLMCRCHRLCTIGKIKLIFVARAHKVYANRLQSHTTVKACNKIADCYTHAASLYCSWKFQPPALAAGRHNGRAIGYTMDALKPLRRGSLPPTRRGIYRECWVSNILNQS